MGYEVLRYGSDDGINDFVLQCSYLLVSMRYRKLILLNLSDVIVALKWENSY